MEYYYGRTAFNNPDVKKDGHVFLSFISIFDSKNSPIAVPEFLAATTVEGDPSRIATLWRNGYLHEVYAFKEKEF